MFFSCSLFDPLNFLYFIPSIPLQILGFNSCAFICFINASHLSTLYKYEEANCKYHPLSQSSKTSLSLFICSHIILLASDALLELASS